MIESGESPLQFPTEIAVKVFGKNEPTFRTAVLTIVRTHYGDEHAVAEQLSKQGAYLSLSVMVVAASREQIDALYKDLTAHDDILMVL
jgi:putative lipoic acid-binding regulatory protein